MKLDKNMRILIIGLGLIGGSYARGLKKQGFTVTAIDRNPKSVKYGLDEEIIDEGYDYVDEETVRKADFVVFALYPQIFIEWIRDYQHLFRPGAILTDVTGVKACIVYKIQDMLREDVEFISAHPMAGREVYGVENSDERIFKDANLIIVPTNKNSIDSILTCRRLGEELGFSRISVLSPEEHDEMIGFVSQLTHCIAVTLMTCSDNTHLACYTGDSFRELTRIARINENMWSELFLLNKDALLEQIDIFLKEFSLFRDLLKNEDAEGIKDKMRISTARRAVFDNTRKGEF